MSTPRRIPLRDYARLRGLSLSEVNAAILDVPTLVARLKRELPHALATILGSPLNARQASHLRDAIEAASASRLSTSVIRRKDGQIVLSSIAAADAELGLTRALTADAERPCTPDPEPETFQDSMRRMDAELWGRSEPEDEDVEADHDDEDSGDETEDDVNPAATEQTEQTEDDQEEDEHVEDDEPHRGWY